jgi:hypothetical protein
MVVGSGTGSGEVNTNLSRTKPVPRKYSSHTNIYNKLSVGNRFAYFLLILGDGFIDI